MKRSKRLLFSVFLIFCTFSMALGQSNNNYNQAMQYFYNGAYDKAKDIFEDLYQDKQYKDVVYDSYINTLIKLNAYADAEKIVNKRIKENGSNYNDQLKLGLILKEKGAQDDADKVFKQVIRDLPADEFVISQVANTFYSINNYELALSTFLNGRLVLKDDKPFTYELINLYRYLKMKEPLMQELIKSVEADPSSVSLAKASFSRSFETDEDYEILKSALFKKVQKNPESIALVDLLAWSFIQLKEYPNAMIQIIALDKRTNDNGSRVFEISELLYQNKAYEDAEKGYQYLISKGSSLPYYIISKIRLLSVKQAQFDLNTPNKENSLDLEKNYEALLQEFGKNSKTIFAIKELAQLKANQLEKNAEAEALLEEAINYPGLTQEQIAEIKLDLSDIYLLDNKPYDASLLLSQVEKALPGQPVAQEAKFKNAQLSFYNGDFMWAKAQLDVLKASTSQLIANDALDLSLLIQNNMQQDTSGEALKIYARAELLRSRNQYLKALATLDSIFIKFPATELADDILFTKARIYLAQNQSDLAIKAYETIASQYPYSIWADDAIYSLGIIYEDTLHNKTQALLYYQKLFDNYAGSLFLIDARKRFRKLRGDAL